MVRVYVHFEKIGDAKNLVGVPQVDDRNRCTLALFLGGHDVFPVVNGLPSEAVAANQQSSEIVARFLQHPSRRRVAHSYRGYKTVYAMCDQMQCCSRYGLSCVALSPVRVKKIVPKINGFEGFVDLCIDPANILAVDLPPHRPRHTYSLTVLGQSRFDAPPTRTEPFEGRRLCHGNPFVQMFLLQRFKKELCVTFTHRLKRKSRRVDGRIELVCWC